MKPPASPAARVSRAAPLRLLTLGWLLLSLAATGCSGVPGAGPAQDVGRIGGAQATASAAAPQPGQQPDRVVRDFIAKAVDTTQDAPGKSLAVARQYLTARAQGGWQQTATAMVILSNTYRTDIASTGVVELKGEQVAVLNADRSYRAVPGRAYSRSLNLTEVDGEWRIENPPTELLMTADDFNRSYSERTVYFLDSGGATLVPDLRYVAQNASKANRADRLVTMLMQGPSSSLAGPGPGAARSQFGPTAKLMSLTTDSADRVHVDFSGINLATQQAKMALAAQLAWTLGADWTGVVITIDSEPLDDRVEYYTTDSTAAFDPDRIPATATPAALDPYYVDPSGNITTIDNHAMWGRLGRSGSVVSAAMSAANGALAAVSAAGVGQQLSIGRPLEFRNAEPVLTATTLTPPSFDRAGNEVWVVQDGASKPKVIRLTTTSPVGREVVEAPELAGKGEVTALALSPDGVRVAVVAGRKLYVGVITHQDPRTPGPSGVTVTGLTEIDPGLSDVGPVAFESATELLVGAKATGVVGGFRVVQQVSIDGRQRDQATDDGITNDVTAIAAGDNFTLIAFDGRVWKLSGALGAGQWVSTNPQEDVVPGSAPFVPN